MSFISKSIVNKKYFSILILLGIFLFFVINNHIVFIEDNWIFPRHEGVNYRNSILFTDSLSGYLPQGVAPLYFIVSGLLIRLFGESLSIALFVNYLLSLIFIVFTYKLASYMYDRVVGILSVLFCISVPTIFALSRYLDFKFSEIVFTPLILYYLLRSEGFTNLKETLFFSVSLTVGVLFRETIVIIVIPLLVFYIFYHLNEMIDNLRNVIVMGLIFLVGITLIVPFFINIESAIVERQEGGVERSLGLSLEHREGIFFYPNQIKLELMPLNLYLFLFAFLYFIYKLIINNDKFIEFFILVFLTMPVLIYTFLFPMHRSVIFVLPMFLPISMMVSNFITNLSHYIEERLSVPKEIVLILFAFIFMMNFLLISYGYEEYYPEEITTRKETFELRYNTRDMNYRGIFGILENIGDPKFGIIEFEYDYKTEFMPELWPMYKDMENIDQTFSTYKEGRIIPQNTTKKTALHTDDNLDDVIEWSDVLALRTPEDFSDREKYEEFERFENRIDNEYEKITEAKTPMNFDNSTLKFYERL